jgi:type IV secretion system protein VirB3
MVSRSSGLVADPLFVAVTRPPMRWGVTFAALLMNIVFTMEAFLLSKNLLTLLIAVPIHGVCALLCLRDPRFFDLLLLWGKTRLPAYATNYGIWKASSCSALDLDLPDRKGRRRGLPVVHLRHSPLERRVCPR